MLQENKHDEEREPEMILTDADTVKELVEMKFLTKKRKIRFRTPYFFRTPQHRIVSRECEVLVDNDSTSYATEKL